MPESTLLKKKKLKEETEEILDAAKADQSGNIPGGQEDRENGPIAKKGTMVINDEKGTVRLSYNLSRQHHKALRIASAHIECTILELLEELISKHLMDRDIELIAADYYTARKVKITKIK